MRVGTYLFDLCPLRFHWGEWCHALHQQHDITPGNGKQW